MNDNVNHPAHYENSCSIECIDAMIICFGKEAVLDFCKLNAFKYIWRYKNKNGLEDLKKANWYLDRCFKLAKDLYADTEIFENMKMYVTKTMMDLCDTMEEENAEAS